MSLGAGGDVAPIVLFLPLQRWAFLDVGMGMFLGNVLRECSLGMFFGNNLRRWCGKKPRRFRHVRTPGGISDTNDRNPAVSDTSGHPADSQTQTIFVVSYTSRNKQETDGSRHSTAPPGAQNSLCGLDFRKACRILLRLRQKISSIEAKERKLWTFEERQSISSLEPRQAWTRPEPQIA